MGFENTWKGKNFMWKARNNLFATRKILLVKNIIKDPMCYVCLQDEKTVMHVLWQCPAVNNVWAVVVKPIQKWRIEEGEFLKLWEELSEKLTQLKWRK